MTTCDAGDVVIVPFPFSDLPMARPRPALVVSGAVSNARDGTTLLAMITTAAAGAKTSDSAIRDLDGAGLRTPSVLRLKLFTLDNRLIARRIGVLSERDRRTAREAVATVFAL